MKYGRSVIVCLFFLSLTFSNAQAGTCTKDDLTKAVDHAVMLINSKGKAALTELDKFRYCGGEGYVFVVDINGTIIMNPIAPTLVGKDFTTLQGAKGEYFGAEMKGKALKQGVGWVSYTWKNPQTGALAIKCSYIKTAVMNGKKVIVGSGIYGIPASDCN